MKLKLAICMEDETYQERFVKCLMNHYKDRYELHVLDMQPELLKEGCEDYDGFILGDYDLEQIGWKDEKKERTILLDEENKYLEVYKIMESLEVLLGNSGITEHKGRKNVKQVIGVYSFTLPHMQIPLAATLASVFGEIGKTIVVDTQEHSGLGLLRKENEVQLSLEDMMVMATARNHTKGRLLSAIGHHQPWDYVYPVKNSCCLSEGSGQVMQGVIDLLVKELDYETVIVNLGTTFSGMKEMAEMCDYLYLPYAKGETGSWREKQFIEEMERKGKNDVFHRICRIEIPPVSGGDGDWERIAEQWKWGSMGDGLRKMIWEAASNG